MREDQPSQAIYGQRNTETRSRNHCCRGKAISIEYYKCLSILALVIRRGNRIFSAPHFIVICVLSYRITFSPHYLKRHDFKKIKTQNVFWFCLQLLPQTFLILKIIKRDIVDGVVRLY